MKICFFYDFHQEVTHNHKTRCYQLYIEAKKMLSCDCDFFKPVQTINLEEFRSLHGIISLSPSLLFQQQQYDFTPLTAGISMLMD